MADEAVSLTGSRWTCKTADARAVAALTAGLGLHRLTAQALVHRGVTDAEAARRFLSHDLAGLGDPFALRDMDRAVALVLKAIETGAPIRIYGDYDVDGVCATALLVRALSGLKAVVDWYIPHRVDEGYGVNEEAVRRAAADGVKLLITVDCGSSAAAQVEAAHALGMEVIITDHHRPDDVLPDAPVVNPWRPGCAYPFKDLAGVGVAFKLVSAVARRIGLPAGHEHRFLDLVCLGTVADVVPLLGENRLFVKHGLEQLPRTRKAGLSALLEVSELRGEVGSRHVAYVLAPRINAVGRMEHARDAVNLLLTADAEEARRLAAELSEQNARRRQEEQLTLEEADRLVHEQVNLDSDRAIVLAHEGWHPGVIGIVASRLVERYHRPTLLIAINDGVGKGSGRSIAAFDLWAGLRDLSSLLVRFGGHRYAAGFSIAPEHVAELRRRFLAQTGAQLSDDDLHPHLEVEAEAELSELTLETVQELAYLAPYGMGNPAPVLVTRGLHVVEAATVGAGAHLSLRLTDASGNVMSAMWFGRGNLREAVCEGRAVNVCYRAQVDTWNGAGRVRLFLEDVAVRGSE